jgi:hypothetical protein
VNGRPLHQLWHTSRDGSSNASGRLPPRPRRALTSINVARNHDVTTSKDDDAPHKQAFTHTEALLQQLRYGHPLPWGLERMANPSASGSTLSGKTAGPSQQRSALSCHPQDAETSPLETRRPRVQQCASPRRINRAVIAPPRDRQGHRRTLSSPLSLRYWHLPQSVSRTWGLPLSRRACNPNCRHLGASNISLIPPLLEVGPRIA